MKLGLFALILALSSIASGTPASGHPVTAEDARHRRDTNSAECGTLNSAEGSVAIQVDISNIVANIVQIDQSFIALNGFGILPGFASGWYAFEQDFANIIWSSRTTALNIAAYCTEFTSVTMPFMENTLSPIPANISVSVLEEYIAEAQSLAQSAQTIENEITTLQANINTFLASYQRRAVSEVDSEDVEIEERQTMPGNVIDEMDTFNSIWSAVIEDSDMVIDFFQDEDITEPFIFWLTMNNINCYYQVMATAMNNYASGVAASAPDLPRA